MEMPAPVGCGWHDLWPGTPFGAEPVGQVERSGGGIHRNAGQLRKRNARRRQRVADTLLERGVFAIE